MRIVVSPVRKCGLRQARAVYAIGGGEGSEDGVLDRFTVISPPIPYQTKVHRNARLVDAHQLLARAPMDEWWFGTSRDTEIKKSGAAWALGVFGMTATKRLMVGECQGVQTPEDALSILVSKVKYHSRIVDYFRDMTLDDIHLNPRVTVHYEQLHEHLLGYTKTQTVGDLIGAQAAIWRIAYNMPPSKRVDNIPNLMRILALMNLSKDAAAMNKAFMN